MKFSYLFCLAFCFASAQAQETKPAQTGAPIRLIVPFTPGTGIDTIARAVAPRLSEKLNQPVLVENRAGASGNIGTEAVVRAKPDGTTLLVTVSTLVTNRALYPKIGFDPVTDLVPLTLAAWGQLMLMVPENSPYKTTSELIAAAKSRPGKLSFSSPGVGTPHHLAMELLKNHSKFYMLHVPYRGTAQALTDLLGGQVDAMFVPIQIAVPQIKAGKLRALGIGAPKRHPTAPQVSTFIEQKFGEIDTDMWYGFMAPKGLPADENQRLSNALRQILSEPELKNTFATQGLDPATSTGAAFKELVEKDAKRWAQVIAAQGIKAD